MASPTLITPTTKPNPFPSLTRPKPIITAPSASLSNAHRHRRRREVISTAASGILSAGVWLLPPTPAALAASDEEYVKETEDVINKVRATVNIDRNDPKVVEAVAQLREASNSWVAKYRREKALLARASFRDIYSALNAVSGHYISFGPTSPIPTKRKARILEEVETAEKALQRGR